MKDYVVKFDEEEVLEGTLDECSSFINGFFKCIRAINEASDTVETTMVVCKVLRTNIDIVRKENK
jgi:hypothetical protein